MKGGPHASYLRFEWSLSDALSLLASRSLSELVRGENVSHRRASSSMRQYRSQQSMVTWKRSAHGPARCSRQSEQWLLEYRDFVSSFLTKKIVSFWEPRRQQRAGQRDGKGSVMM